LDELNKHKKNLSSQAGGKINEKASEASFIVSYCVPKAGTVHTVAKTLCKVMQ
jgi:hypothetical protein